MNREFSDIKLGNVELKSPSVSPSPSSVQQCTEQSSSPSTRKSPRLSKTKSCAPVTSASARQSPSKYSQYYSSPSPPPMTSIRSAPSSVYSLDENDDSKRAVSLLEVDSLIDNMCASVNVFNAMVHHLRENDLTYGKEIARGTRGSVHEVFFEMNGLKVKAAAKRIYNNSFSNVSNVLNNVKLQILQQNPIIPTTTKIYGVTASPETYINPSSSFLQRTKETNDGPQLIIIYELGECNLMQLYEREQVPMHVTLELFSKLACMVHLIHGSRIIHRDIKPQNIIVMNYSRGLDGLITNINCRFTDLGLSLDEFMDDIISPNGDIGTGGFHAPEILHQQAYNFKSDIFMLGITFCLLIQAPKMLKSNGAERLLRYMHEVKVCKRLGRSMYEATVEKELMQWNYNMVPPKVKDIICEMIEVKELRRINLQTISYLCSKHGDTCLELEASQRLIGVKPLCPIITPPVKLRIQEAVDKRNFEIDAMQALRTIENSADYQNQSNKIWEQEEEAETEKDSLFNPEECLQLQQAMKSATKVVPCIATNTFRDDCKQPVKDNNQTAIERDINKNRENFKARHQTRNLKRTREEENHADELYDQPSTSKLHKPASITAASINTNTFSDDCKQPEKDNDEESIERKIFLKIKDSKEVLYTRNLKRTREEENQTAGLDDQPSTSKQYKPASVTAASQLSSDDLNSESTFMLVEEPKTTKKVKLIRETRKLDNIQDPIKNAKPTSKSKSKKHKTKSKKEMNLRTSNNMIKKGSKRINRRKK